MVTILELSRYSTKKCRNTRDAPREDGIVKCIELSHAGATHYMTASLGPDQRAAACLREWWDVSPG